MIIAGLILASALPFWATLITRDREAESMWQETQYARAIDLFRQRYRYVFPPDVDPLDLAAERALLMTRLPELPPQFPNPSASERTFSAQEVHGPDPLNSTRDADGRGGIIGVVSGSPDVSLGRFNGATLYNRWAFTPQTVYGKRAEGGSPLKGGPPPPGAN